MHVVAKKDNPPRRPKACNRTAYHLVAKINKKLNNKSPTQGGKCRCVAEIKKKGENQGQYQGLISILRIIKRNLYQNGL